jgi:plasmid stabilization system protein ParE
MNLRRSDDFISDLERQYEWYVINAGLDIAEQYLITVEATCRMLGQHPQLGPVAGFAHPRLANWRFIVVFRPFQKHLLFYEINEEGVILRRAMHGHRDLPRRLIDPPGTG